MNKYVLRTAIGVSWITLIVCAVVKVLGANWFELSIDPEKFAIVDTNIWIQIALCSVTSYGMFTLNYLAICQEKRFKWYIHVSLIPYFIGITAAKLFMPAQYHFLVDLVTAIAIPLVLVRFTNRKYFRVIVGYVFNWGFQAISVFIRNIIPTEVASGSILVELVLSLDVIIMLVLYWLYSLYDKIKEEEVVVK